MLDKKEILRYLGAENSGTALDDMISRAENEIIHASRPKHVYRLVDIEPGENVVIADNAEIKSKDLARHLRGCRNGFLFACTLGPEVDSLVKRYSLTDLPMLPVAQAVASAYTEYCVDQAQKELETYASGNGLYLRPRYSPGYGDFSLQYQRFFFRHLEIQKRIGVCLTDACLMIPFKSVTAIIGLSSDPSQCHINRCMVCSAQNCPFRKDDVS